MSKLPDVRERSGPRRVAAMLTAAAAALASLAIAPWFALAQPDPADSEPGPTAAATRPATTRPAGPAEAPATQVVGRAGTLTRLAARPALTPDQAKAKADELRAAYAKPAAEWPKPTIDAGVEFVELGLVRRPQFPPENPFTEAKAELGQMLFFDPRLSGSGQIACASCHEPELGWSDGRAVSFGHARSPLRRNAPALTNVWSRKSLFWDGRADTLEHQALEPIAASDEMNADAGKMVALLAEQGEYRKRFAAVFDGEGDGADAKGKPAAERPAGGEGTGPDDEKPATGANRKSVVKKNADEQGNAIPDASVVTIDRVARALATYERTIASRASDFDRFLAGKADVLSDSAVRGLHLFRTDARCANCHMGPTLTDEQFHDVGLSYYGRELEDLGRYGFTRDPKDAGKFRTPSLRNLPRTGPYMHNGLFELRGVLNLYNAGMPALRPRADQADDPKFPVKSPLLKPLGLNRQDLEDLLAFLGSLEETKLRVRPPALPGITPAVAGPMRTPTTRPTVVRRLPPQGPRLSATTRPATRTADGE